MLARITTTASITAIIIASLPVADAAAAEDGQPDAVASKESEREDDDGYLGPRIGLSVPLLRGERFNPQWTAALSYRMENDGWFLDLAGGVAIAYPEVLGKSINSYWALQAEVDAGFRLANGAQRPYLAIGAAPRMVIGSGGAAPSVVPVLAGYGEAGIDIGDNGETRYFLVVRLLQFVTGFPMVREPWNSRHSNDRYPTEISFSTGIGW